MYTYLNIIGSAKRLYAVGATGGSLACQTNVRVTFYLELILTPKPIVSYHKLPLVPLICTPTHNAASITIHSNRFFGGRRCTPRHRR